MKILFYGTGYRARNICMRLKSLPESIEWIGFVDRDPSKCGERLYDKPIYPPGSLISMEFDFIVVMVEGCYEEIKRDLMYWFKVDESKIVREEYLLKLLLADQYRDTDDQEIKDIFKYWEKHEVSVYNQYVKTTMKQAEVFWDCIENLPYIFFEDKKMYFPYDMEFAEIDGRRVVLDIMAEQQETSPHRYIYDDITVENGDVVVDAGVAEGNFALRYIDRVSKIYLFECEKRWVRALEKTFEKFKDKVIICNKYLGRENNHECTNLDSVILDGRLDFLKMDIEGAELDALYGAERTLRNNNVKCAICSYHRKGHEAAIKEILNTYGYTTSHSKGYMLFYHDIDIYSEPEFRRGIVYGRK